MQPQPASDTIPISSITIRNLDPAVKERLRVRAAQHGHSMEAEARDIISSAVGAERPREVNLAEAIRRRFAPLGGSDDWRSRHANRPAIPPGSTDVRAPSKHRVAAEVLRE
jgi:antitoxin FitA